MKRYVTIPHLYIEDPAYPTFPNILPVKVTESSTRSHTTLPTHVLHGGDAGCVFEHEKSCIVVELEAECFQMLVHRI